MEKYPKLIGIGITLPSRHPEPCVNTPPYKTYLLEDEHCYVGHTPDSEDNWCFPWGMRPSKCDAVALRHCHVLFPPKGDENVDNLYLNAMNYKNGWATHYKGVLKRKGEKERWCRMSDPNNLQTDLEKEAIRYY